MPSRPLAWPRPSSPAVSTNQGVGDRGRGVQHVGVQPADRLHDHVLGQLGGVERHVGGRPAMQQRVTVQHVPGLQRDGGAVGGDLLGARYGQVAQVQGDARGGQADRPGHQDRAPEPGPAEPGPAEPEPLEPRIPSAAVPRAAVGELRSLELRSSSCDRSSCGRSSCGRLACSSARPWPLLPLEPLLSLASVFGVLGGLGGRAGERVPGASTRAGDGERHGARLVFGWRVHTPPGRFAYVPE